MTFQDQLNELQHQIDSLNAKLNHAEGEIMWLRGFLAGNRVPPCVNPPLIPTPPPPYVNLPYIQPLPMDPFGRNVTTCAREPNGFDQFDTETGTIKAAIPTIDNDEGTDSLLTIRQALTDPDDYLGNLV